MCHAFSVAEKLVKITVRSEDRQKLKEIAARNAVPMSKMFETVMELWKVTMEKKKENK